MASGFKLLEKKLSQASNFVNSQRLLHINLKQVLLCSIKNLIFVNIKPRISVWHFQKVPCSHIWSKEILKAFFGNYKNIACNVIRPHTNVFPVPLSKKSVYLHISALMSTINFEVSSMLLCYTLKPIGGNACWVTPTLSPLVPVIGQRICQMSYWRLIFYFPMCAVLLTVNTCYSC